MPTTHNTTAVVVRQTNLHASAKLKFSSLHSPNRLNSTLRHADSLNVLAVLLYSIYLRH